MGMLARYIAVSEDELNRLIDLGDEPLTDEIDMLEEKNPTLDLDKMWDGLHFILTGVSASEPLEGDPLSDAIVGVHVIDDETFIAATGNGELKEIINALSGVDRKALKAEFSPRTLDEENIYPDIWQSENKDSLFEELEQALEQLIHFYQQCLKDGSHVLVTIF
ncbi:hypothetical protein SOASR030_33610 [Leminorella grimontii]|uniref:DUF1877 family protein n=1 Tax=Leminorella grimontii TaxID=82981 RepID=A0AAV5N676_9GAMM|nr:YfbM family protein [Leminorella grimontii]KFC98406.1 hypothetical protein GLGR_0003 [Leminorella grimontii ATCC 33999 = DSM 5078]GKX57249.1 hypothetical protein SOASR030_33610 [Leminorella grimontii]GKX61327.1 hypothetical protein SOASR031_36420 [Leminorella grimontii]VFS55885.1 Domain of uncharacterised function (DUF1877) [Leminorella grimontii]